MCQIHTFKHTTHKSAFTILEWGLFEAPFFSFHPQIQETLRPKRVLPNQTNKLIRHQNAAPLTRCSAISFPQWGSWKIKKHGKNGGKSRNSYGSLVHMRIWWFRNPVNSPVEVGSLSHYLQGFIHFRWLFGILSINSRVSQMTKSSKNWSCAIQIFSNACVRPKNIYKTSLFSPFTVWFLIFKCCVTGCDNQCGICFSDSHWMANHQ